MANGIIENKLLKSRTHNNNNNNSGFWLIPKGIWKKPDGFSFFLSPR
jgi:hypothetical protein